MSRTARLRRQENPCSTPASLMPATRMRARMRPIAILSALSLLVLAAPAATAGHTYSSCMQAWYPAPPPGWSNVCSTTDWWAHNPFTPLVSCLVAPLSITIIGVQYDVAQALACV